MSKVSDTCNQSIDYMTYALKDLCCFMLVIFLLTRKSMG